MKKIFFSLICALGMAFSAYAETATTVYYAIPDAQVGTYTVKLNVCLQWNGKDGKDATNIWQQFDMGKTKETYKSNPIYKATFTDKWDGANTMQFQLYDGENWKSQEVAFDGNSDGENQGKWTTADTYNGKMFVFGETGWQAYKPDGADPDPDPETAKFYIVGNETLMGEGKHWNLENAIKVTEDTYTFKNLAAGDYALKVLPVLDWGKALGYNELSEKPEGLAADKDGNVTFTLAEAGDVVVTYIAGENITYTVKGKFYVKPADPETYNTLRFVPNVWAQADAKIAAWIWGETLDGQFTAFFAGEGDTLTVEINTKADSIIFVRFNSGLAEPKWNTEEEKNNEWNRIDKMKINTESMVFTITDWTQGTWDVYTPARFYIVGNEALMGEGKDWKLEYAIKVTEDSYTFKNLAAGDYALKALTALDWETALGFNALSEKTAGLAGDKDDNVTFTLAEAGDVVVTYIAGEVPTYTVTGKFVVPSDPEITRVDFSLLNAGDLSAYDAKIFVHTWGEGMSDEDIQMTAIMDGEAVVGYKAAINALTQNLVFVRMNPENDVINWDDNWGKSNDLARCEGDKAYFTGWSENTINVSCDEPTDVETISRDAENGKVIVDGILYILRDGRRYNAQGIEVK